MRSKPPLSTGLVALSLIAAASPRALAADFLIPGIQAKASAGAGQTVSRGATALFFNPANLSTARGLLPEADLSVAQISYSYQHADSASYDPATLATMTPLATVGLAWKPLRRLGLGFALLPTGSGSAQVDNGVPAEISPGIYEPMNITRKQTAFRAATGASWEFGDSVAIGASLLYFREASQIVLVRSGTDNNFLVADYKGTSMQFSGGARITLKRDYVIGLSYRTAVKRPYTGTLAVNTSSSTAAEATYQTSDFKGVGYDPSQLGFGLEGRWGKFGAFFDYVREQWSGGRAVFKQGLGADANTIDLIDSQNLTVGARFWPTPKQRLGVAFGMDGGNMGTGDPVVKGTATPEVGGVRVGQLEAVPRTIFAGGYRYGLTPASYLEAAGVYMNGTLNVPSGYSQEGTFKLTVLMVSGGAAYRF